MGVLGTVINQSFNLPKPVLTEKNLPSQAGKVFIVTGGYAGVGEQLATILYGANGTVYVAGRSQEKATKAISRIQTAHPDSKGTIEFLKLDLADLASIKPAVEAFLAKESRLDVLTNNAGVMIPPAGSKTTQGHELQIGTNCLGHFLFTQLLQPILASTAKQAPPGSVRVTWAGSLAVDLMSPKPGGLKFGAGEEGKPLVLGRNSDYGQSKVGNLMLSCEAKRHWGDSNGVVHVCWNPGNLKSELQRHAAGGFLMNPLLYPAVYGAYTELYAGWSEDIGLQQSGSFIIPWGRVGSFRPDIQEALKSKADGGTGKAAAFWDWCEKETSSFR